MTEPHDDQPTEQQGHPNDGRDGRGRFTRTLEVAQRDAEAARLRGRGLSYRKIAEALGVEPSTAYEAVKRALTETLAEPAAEVRALELERLDDLWERAVKVADREHVTVSGGKIVYESEGVALRDDAPALAAIRTLLAIQERRAKLLGLDAPVKADTGVRITYDIVGINTDAL